MTTNVLVISSMINLCFSQSKCGIQLIAELIYTSYKKSNCHKSRGLFLPCCNNLVTIAINQSILKSQSIRSNQIASQLLVQYQCSTIIMNQVYVGVWIMNLYLSNSLRRHGRLVVKYPSKVEFVRKDFSLAGKICSPRIHWEQNMQWTKKRRTKWNNGTEATLIATGINKK